MRTSSSSPSSSLTTGVLSAADNAFLMDFGINSPTASNGNGNGGGHLHADDIVSSNSAERDPLSPSTMLSNHPSHSQQQQQQQHHHHFGGSGQHNGSSEDLDMDLSVFGGGKQQSQPNHYGNSHGFHGHPSANGQGQGSQAHQQHAFGQQFQIPHPGRPYGAQSGGGGMDASFPHSNNSSSASNKRSSTLQQQQQQQQQQHLQQQQQQQHMSHVDMGGHYNMHHGHMDTSNSTSTTSSLTAFDPSIVKQEDDVIDLDPTDPFHLQPHQQNSMGGVAAAVAAASSSFPDLANVPFHQAAAFLAAAAAAAAAAANSNPGSQPRYGSSQQDMAAAAAAAAAAMAASANSASSSSSSQFKPGQMHHPMSHSMPNPSTGGFSQLQMRNAMQAQQQMLLQQQQQQQQGKVRVGGALAGNSVVSRGPVAGDSTNRRQKFQMQMHTMGQGGVNGVNTELADFDLDDLRNGPLSASSMGTPSEYHTHTSRFLRNHPYALNTPSLDPITPSPLPTPTLMTPQIQQPAAPPPPQRHRSGSLTMSGSSATTPPLGKVHPYSKPTSASVPSRGFSGTPGASGAGLGSTTTTTTGKKGKEKSVAIDDEDDSKL
ncbi:hypothetical protein HDU97_001103 [Phlyctochytrium planicorne]|nr:hypothetical protein HDU97_001103 [Phlyctochytrium planicorne]